MNTVEQAGFIGPERIDERIGHSGSRVIERYGSLSIMGKPLENGDTGFFIEWTEGPDGAATLYHGGSYLDARRVYGYATECIKRNYARGEVVSKILAYAESLSREPRRQLSPDDFTAESMEGARERGNEAEMEGAHDYIPG